MSNLTMTDLQILNLGIIGNGRFDENDIAKSDLSKLGVGRILDQLASLKERNLININKDGSFAITKEATSILWNSQTPTETKILRILEIGPQMSQKLASILLSTQEKIEKSLEGLRKNHLILMSTVKNEMGIIKMYEILPEGIEYLEKPTTEKNQNGSDSNNNSKNVQLLENIIEKVTELAKISEEEKTEIISGLKKIRENLEK